LGEIVGGIPKPKPCFLDQFTKTYIDGTTKVFVDDENDRLYTWDSLHGEIEVFNKRGRHIAVFDPDGNWIKDAVRGRKISKPN
jgi:hypothetical protein